MAQGASNFTTHLKQIDAVSEPLATQITEDNTTVVNASYVVTKHSLGTHFDMNTANNYYVTLEINGLNSWRHIHGYIRFSNYSTGGGQTHQWYHSTTNGSSGTFASHDIANTELGTSFRTINSSWSQFGLPVRQSMSSSQTRMQWNFRSGRYHPMVWVDFTVATHGGYAYSPDIGDIKLHATNSTI